ncbi:MAG: hypothetical protein QG670_1988 [Thermoproteota archaeon]|nr:hypothetical protein [Thermoproteota archaeon]
MSKSVKTVEIDATVKDAVQKMNRFNIGSVIVTDSDRKKILGILTERDILRLVEEDIAPLEIKVKEVMSHQPCTVDASSTIEEAAELMAKRHVKRLPVLEEDKLVGVITSSDIIRANPLLIKALMDTLKPRPPKV